MTTKERSYMINSLGINIVRAPVDEHGPKYVVKKLSRLDPYLPRDAHDSAHAEIQLKEGKTGKNTDGRSCCAEVTLHLPHDTINVSETSINMYTAIDIVELKLKQRIKKYKELHAATLRRRLVARFVR